MSNLITLINNRGILLSKISRNTFLLSIVIYIPLLGFSIFLIFNKDYYLSLLNRHFLIAFSFIPGILLLLNIIRYELQYPQTSYKTSVSFSLLLVLLYSLFPAFFVGFRYYNLVGLFDSITKIFFMITVTFSPLFVIKKFNIFKTVYEILYKAWQPKSPEFNKGYFTKMHIDNIRQKEYLNPETLEAFQSSFTKYSSEPEAISMQLETTKFKKLNNQGISVLDVGGYNGVFSERLLRSIKLPIKKIKLIDPINKSKEYSSNLSALCNEIQYTKKKIEEYLPDSVEKFDVILASHSLYSYLDSDYKKINLILAEFCKYLNENGIIIILLGSIHSPAYSLKNQIFETFYGENCSDINSLNFLNQSKEERNLHLRSVVIDNYINISEILSSDEKLINWVCYFVRLPKFSDLFFIDQIKKFLASHSVLYSQLPETVKSSREIEIDDAALLLHKTECFFISKNESVFG